MCCQLDFCDPVDFTCPVFCMFFRIGEPQCKGPTRYTKAFGAQRYQTMRVLCKHVAGLPRWITEPSRRVAKILCFSNTTDSQWQSPLFTQIGPNLKEAAFGMRCGIGCGIRMLYQLAKQSWAALCVCVALDSSAIQKPPGIELERN